ncbi:MAG: NAD(P)H-dependent oxidoreductase [Cyanobacteriota bacterium]|nr:NAD(P)H-dependent oxidoreductase [Cyanobacteriota bacterium]
MTTATLQPNSPTPAEPGIPIKIVALGGSLRHPSTTYAALHYLAEEMAQLGVHLEILDLRQMRLPFCDGGETYPDFPDVAHLKAAVKAADAIVLASPEYHGSISGVLKNALDLLGFEEMADKVFGAISVLGGESNSNSLNDLRVIVRWLHGWMIPEQIAIGKAWQAFDTNGQIKDERLRQRFTAFARSLISHTAKLRGIPLRLD